MTALKTSVLALLFCLGLVACVNAHDPDVVSYLEYKSETPDPNSFDRLPDGEKIKIFFGAMKVHPPASSIEADIANEDLSFLLKLKSEIESRGGSLEAYSFINAVAMKLKNGSITRAQVDAMQLAQFCRQRGDDYNLCTNILILMSDPKQSRLR